MLKQTKFADYFTPDDRQPEDRKNSTKKIKALLKHMTIPEKISLTAGNPDPNGKVGNAGYLRGIPRFGVPEVRMFDGPAGIMYIKETTGLPVPQLLACTWDEDAAYAFGEIAGSENAAVSGNCQLGTQVDLMRTPHFARNRDMKGEDYVLSAKLAVAETRAIQDQHVIACLKHFAAANTTDMTELSNEIVDEQTLHQMYLRPFEDAVQEGGAGAVMDAYSGIGGKYATENVYLNKTVLRDMWKFDGAVMSDWGANHRMTLDKGMDIEMPLPAFNSSHRILRGIQNGDFTWDELDEAADHVLGMMASAGLLSMVTLDEDGNPMEEFGRTEPIRMASVYEKVKTGMLDRHAAAALSICREGIVLAKNDRQALPLREDEHVVWIGPGAVSPVCGYMQERSFGRLERMLSPARHYENMTGKKADAYTAVDYIGETIPAEYLYQDADGVLPGICRYHGSTDACVSCIPSAVPFGPGGAGVEFNGITGELDDYGELVENEIMGTWGKTGLTGDGLYGEAGSFCQVDAVIDFSCRTTDYRNGAGGTAFTVGDRYTWFGYLKAPETGSYMLKLESIGGESVFLIKTQEGWQQIGHSSMREGAQWPWDSIVNTEEGMGILTKEMDLEKDRLYPILLIGSAGDPNKDFQIRAAWVTPSRQRTLYEEAVHAVDRADKVVLFLNEIDETKKIIPGDLADIRLPECQLGLFRDISAAAKKRNIPLITVYQGSGSLEARVWHADSDAVVITYYPGQEGAQALTEILLGIVNPGGKLAATWPEQEEDTPVTDTKLHRKYRLEGVRENGMKNHYFSEGIFTGYRWYERNGVEPAFCFGHGLSYTTFAYSDLCIEPVGNTYRISCTVENTGELTGDEIVQVYLGKPEDVPAGIQMAEKQLAAFTRVKNIAPGCKKTAEMLIDWRELCYWNPAGLLNLRENGTRDKYQRAVGERSVYVGASVKDIRLTGRILVE